MGHLKDFILDLIFPRHCLGCGILLGNECKSYVCPGCLKKIPLANGFACAFCRSPVKAGKTCVYCAKDHFLDRLLVVTSYDYPLVEKIIKTIKYRFVKSLVNEVADVMINYLKKKSVVLQNYEFDSLVAVPLHRRRLNWRGFNQSEIAAEKIAGYLGIPLIKNVLKRSWENKPQTEMPDRNSRIKNVQNLFLYTAKEKNKIEQMGKTVLLVDDISTTGSTLNDCARALKEGGAEEVIGLVFARNRI